MNQEVLDAIRENTLSQKEAGEILDKFRSELALYLPSYEEIAMALLPSL